MIAIFAIFAIVNIGGAIVAVAYGVLSWLLWRRKGRRR